jgi:hypothetical protein
VRAQHSASGRVCATSTSGAEAACVGRWAIPHAHLHLLAGPSVHGRVAVPSWVAVQVQTVGDAVPPGNRASGTPRPLRFTPHPPPPPLTASPRRGAMRVGGYREADCLNVVLVPAVKEAPLVYITHTSLGTAYPSKCRAEYGGALAITLHCHGMCGGAERMWPCSSTCLFPSLAPTLSSTPLIHVHLLLLQAAYSISHPTYA